MPDDFSSRAEAIRRRCEAVIAEEGCSDWAYGNCSVRACFIRGDWNGTGSGKNIEPRCHAKDVRDLLAILAQLTAQVETLQGERDEAREIVAKVNNEVIGSDNYFTHPSCVDEVRKLKAQATAEYQRANAAETQVETLTKERDQLDWAARKFQARISELMQTRKTPMSRTHDPLAHQDGWRPIATYSGTNGERVLIWDGVIRIGQLWNGEWRDDDSRFMVRLPSLWMPLPTAEQIRAALGENKS